MNSIIWFLDLYSQYKHGRSRAQDSSGKDISNWNQALVYLACLIGIFAGPFAIGAAKGRFPPLRQLIGGWDHAFWSVLFAFVLTALLFKVALKPTSPLVVQIGSAIATGIASEKLIPVALDALSKFTLG